MNKIIIYRTRIEINNYELGDCSRIEKTFSVWDQIRHKLYPKGYVYDKEKKILKVPRGIDINWLENCFMTDAVVNKSYDEYDEIAPIGETKLKYLPRDEVQQKALRFMIGVNEYEKTTNIPMLSINLPTGKGKTYCSIASMVAMNIKGIIITNSVEWLNQWKRFITEYTNIREDEIYFISGENSVNYLLNNDNSKYKMYLSTHMTLQNFGTEYGWECISELFRSIRVGIKIYDEAHLNFENMYRIDFYTNTFKTFYVTATPGRSDYEENLIFNLYFKNIPAIDLFDSENDPHTEYYAIKYNSHPTLEDINHCKNMYGMDRNKYVSYIVDNENFYKLLYILITKSLSKEGKSLYYIGLNSSILKVKEWIENNFYELRDNVGVFTSITDSDIKNDQLNKKIILSTTKSAGAAIDIPDLKEIVCLAEPFKSKIIAQQSLGRARNSDTIYTDVVDVGFNSFNNYYNYKKPVFNKYASKCSEILLNDQELDNRYTKAKESRHLIKPIIKHI